MLESSNKSEPQGTAIMLVAVNDIHLACLFNFGVRSGDALQVKEIASTRTRTTDQRLLFTLFHWMFLTKMNWK